ncbi:hypothetical protein FHU41_001098 [Psychromicrobium silvestre]|uniref:Uncharacterized protein n=1 Tax=Psychromicrobium silvestre TaxID=1645614 RepID=A0A7Y9LSP1_9MICC|nr:hypothetical protein [Psychromicrobium silvestre]NYE94877.1 hypothetical protein [Psychromicrobium silvestre]
MKRFMKGGSRPLQLGALSLGLLSALAGSLVIAPSAIAATTDQPGYTVEPVGTPLEPGYTVENYIHPNAEQIAATTNILLKEGDGQIIYATCDSSKPTQIKVESSIRPGAKICFDVTGPTGWLKMEIPGSFGVRSGAKELTITTTESGAAPEQQTVPANTNMGIDPIDSGEVTLVELRVK